MTENYKKSAIVMLLLAAGVARAQAVAEPAPFASCDAYLSPARTVGDARVGPSSCLMHEVEFGYKGRQWVRADMGLDGTVEGFVTREGDYREYLTNAPELVFPQSQASDPQEPVSAIANYERLRGAAILLVHPARRRDWNGKLWVTAHGRGRSFHNGALQTWHQYLDPDDPTADLNKLERAMLSLGYAVAVTRRTSEENVGEIITTLEDGTVVDWVAFNDTHSLIKDYADVAEAALLQRLGRKPQRTYLYGKSAGARLARGMNYLGHRLNRRADGTAVFDGFLVDDSAAGTWLPVVMEEGRDVLLDEAAEREAFVPQLELAHQSYLNFNDHDLPEFVTYSFLANKYSNARILLDKGLGDRFRLYEIRQLSHDGGSTLADGRRGRLQILDLSLLMEGAIGILDAWVEGTEAPPSRSDFAAIGDANGDGIVENPALEFPEVACPLGYFYPYPQSGSGATSWAAFTGTGIEPRDERGVFVDMNRNGLWDYRESPSEAWRRLGLLGQDEELTIERYVNCVGDAAAALAASGFFNTETVGEYVKRAGEKNIQPASDDEHALIYFSRF